jgi:glyoxylase-like metal-dependent hydrolase (beta-lactamase superfamily II)
MLKKQLGDIVIHRILESESPDFDPYAFFPQTPKEAWAPHLSWLQPKAVDPKTGNLVFPMQSFLLRTQHHTIMVDTCVGDHKQRVRPQWNMTSTGAYLQRLAETGVRPEQVDYVMCTHMHSDHVGWNTRMQDGRWVPTFPKAKYLMSGKELEYWQTLHKQTPQNQIADSVLPIVAAGKAQLVTNDFRLSDEVWFESTPGHTPDHMSVRVQSKGAQAVVTGDLIHSPVQCLEPDWVPRPDYDPPLAAQTRRAFMERYAETDVLICASHFPSPSFGHFRANGKGFKYVYEGER